MGSFRQIYYQIVFGTRYRQAVIPEEYCNDLYSYIAGLIRNKKSTPYQINGIEDHIHIFCDLHPTIALSDFIKDIKVASNLWMADTGNFSRFYRLARRVWRVHLLHSRKRYDLQLREKAKSSSQKRNIL